MPTLSRLLRLLLAAATDPKALLERVAETYRNLKRYEFDFTLLTDIRSAAGRKSVETHIELTNVRPDKLRILISGGLGEVQVYSDGAVSSIFVPALKQYTRKATSDAKADCGRWSLTLRCHRNAGARTV